MDSAKNVVSQALELGAAERAGIVEQLLASLDAPDDRIDALWAAEADARAAAYNQGELESIPADQVFARYRRK